MIDDPRGLAANIAARPIVILDFDGTLGDTTRVLASTANQAMLDMGMTPEEIGDPERLVGPPWPAGFIKVYGMDPERAKAITARAEELHSTIDQYDFPIFDGVVELLERLKASDKRVGVVSSRMTTHVHDMLEAKGLASYMDFAFGQDDHSKASKALAMSQALAALGVTGADAVEVGDRLYDVEASHTNGLPCVGVTYGAGGRDELVEAGADIIVDTPAEVGEVLFG